MKKIKRKRIKPQKNKEVLFENIEKSIFKFTSKELIRLENLIRFHRVIKAKKNGIELNLMNITSHF